jgi:hypothetical protein
MYIKTKRTNGHNILIGGLVGAVPILIGSSTSNDGYGVVAAVLLTPVFAAIGSGIGYITTLFKNSQHYSIQGDPIKWQGFKEAMFAPE